LEYVRISILEKRIEDKCIVMNLTKYDVPYCKKNILIGYGNTAQIRFKGHYYIK
jgi:hypothetical protein